MPKFLKDYISPMLCAGTLIVGMAYSSGAQDQRIKTLEAVSTDLREQLRSLQKSMVDLQETVAAQTQELRDQRRESAKHDH